MITLTTVETSPNGTPTVLGFDAPIEYRARFMPGTEGGKLSLNYNTYTVNILSCFRSTPGASISPHVLDKNPSIRQFLANILEHQKPREFEEDYGYGRAVVPTLFTRELMETPLAGLTSSGVPIFAWDESRVLAGMSLRDLAETKAVEHLGALRRKTRKAQETQEKSISLSWGGSSVLHALRNFPRTYRDVTRLGYGVSLEREGQEEALTATYVTHRESRLPNQTPMLSISIIDGQGKSSNVALFGENATNAKPWMRVLAEGDQIIMFGRIKEYNGRPTLSATWVHPLALWQGKMLPIYPSKKNALSAMNNRELTRAAITPSPMIVDPVPGWVRSQYGLMSRSDAYAKIHHPSSWAEQMRARERLVWDEFLWVASRVSMSRHESTDPSIVVGEEYDRGVREAVNRFPYELSEGQSSALNDVRRDMMSGRLMRRLIQGDVGCGKTSVAVAVAAGVVAEGGQVAVLAPTSVLARQLYSEVKEAIPNTVLVSGGAASKANQSKAARIAEGSVKVAVGTHTLLSPDLSWKNLALVIVDEQHKFGTQQRNTLLKENPGAHFLMMSATPIPSAIASITYGDLDLTRITTLPGGRHPITTVHVPVSGNSIVNSPTHDVWKKAKDAIDRGENVYVINSLVEQSEDRASVVETARRLEQVFPMQVGSLYGAMSAKEKDEQIELFKNRSQPILVSSSVVEVGVSVPHATLIIILDATRFGLSSLHQMRGRVGRGTLPSTCVLVGEFSASNPEDSQARMQAMCEHSNGFDIAEIDFQLRNEGEYFGDSQSGKTDLGLASLKRDREIVETAKSVYQKLDPETRQLLYEESLIVHP